MLDIQTSFDLLCSRGPHYFFPDLANRIIVTNQPQSQKYLAIIFESNRLIAINKPVGLATQAPSGIDSLEWRVKRYLAFGKKTSGKVYLGVPHRLDRPASGAIVFAKDKVAARHLAEQFQIRTVKKTYWALVNGCVNSESGTWTDWMKKIPDEARSEICQEDDSGAQMAVLHYTVVRHSESESLIEIQLETGRSHQIRLQASSRGFPIHGDALYGSAINFGPEVDDERLKGIALHARLLVITDPDSGQPLDLVAEPPEFWRAVS